MSGIALSFLAGGAGGGVTYWIATLTGASAETANAVALDNSGNIYVAGQTTTSGAGGDDFLLVKYNTNGVIQWQKLLGGNSTDRAYGVAIDSSNNIYVVGDFASNIVGDYDMALAKYDTSGNLQWQRSLGSSPADTAYGVAVDSSGYVYVTGRSLFSSVSYDAIIAKYDSSGTIQWQNYLAGGSGDHGRGVGVDSSGNSYMGGYTSSSGAGSLDVLLAKYNTSGTIQWQRTLGSSNTEIGYAATADSSGNSYVTGYATNGSSVLVAKYDTSGTIQWQRTLTNTSGYSQSGYSIAVDASGNVYVTGYSQNVDGFDILIAKYNSSGTIQWQRTLGSAGTDTGFGITVDLLGDVYVVGQVDTNIVIAKLPSDGSLTGVYGPWTYAASSLTAATSGLTSATSTLTSSTSTLIDSTPTLTSATSTLTSTVITL